MTSKAKAIEALNSGIQNNMCFLSRTQLEIVMSHINKPTLDDAIKVVEEIKKDLANIYAIVCETEHQKAISITVNNVLEDILTALKGLKERE